MKSRIAVCAVGILCWFGNPLVGCSSGEESWQFGESEMRSAVSGIYVGELGDSGESVTLELDEAQTEGTGSTQALPIRRLQCGSRSFIRAAGACDPHTSMAISGTIASAKGSIALMVVTGTFTVSSYTLSSGYLNLTLADGAQVSASFEQDHFVNWKLTTSSNATTLLSLTKQ